MLWHAGELSAPHNDDLSPAAVAAAPGRRPDSGCFATLGAARLAKLVDARQKLSAWTALDKGTDEYTQAEIAYLVHSGRPVRGGGGGGASFRDFDSWFLAAQATAALLARKRKGDEGAALQRRCLAALGWCACCALPSARQSHSSVGRHSWIERADFDKRVNAPEATQTIL